MLDELRRYELYVIFQPGLEEQQLEEQIARTDGYLTNNGGTILEIVRKGKRRLEYPIQRHNQGIDVIYQLFLPASSLETLERQLNLNENVIRYLVIRREDLEETEQVLASAEEIEAEVTSLQAEPTALEIAAAEEPDDASEGEEEIAPVATEAEPLVEEDISMMEGSPARAYAAEEAAPVAEDESGDEENEATEDEVAVAVEDESNGEEG